MLRFARTHFTYKSDETYCNKLYFLAVVFVRALLSHFSEHIKRDCELKYHVHVFSASAVLLCLILIQFDFLLIGTRTRSNRQQPKSKIQGEVNPPTHGTGQTKGTSTNGKGKSSYRRQNLFHFVDRSSQDLCATPEPHLVACQEAWQCINNIEPSAIMLNQQYPSCCGCEDRQAVSSMPPRCRVVSQERRPWSLSVDLTAAPKGVYGAPVLDRRTVLLVQVAGLPHGSQRKTPLPPPSA